MVVPSEGTVVISISIVVLLRDISEILVTEVFSFSAVADSVEMAVW